MKRIFLMIVVLIMFVSTTLSQTLTMPRPSPKAKLTQRIGLIDVSVDYSRPSVIRGNNDRTGQIWGVQVPYGLAPNGFGNLQDMPWRAGANENTIITTSADLMVEDKILPAGSYGLHMIPYEDGKVTVIFSTNTSSWGSFWYSEDEDALRVDVMSKDGPFTNVLTYEFTELGVAGGTLALSWDTKQIPIQLICDQEVILQSFRDELRGIAGFGWQGPFSAANYCSNNNVNLEEAITWADRAVNANRNGNTVGLKAGLMYQSGDKEAALKLADEAAEIANQAELNGLGYRMIALGEPGRAVEYFELNVKRNPTVANMYDSLGEGLVAKGDNKEAVKMFKKSLSMNPPQFVKANSIANLKRLGVEYTE